MPSDLQNTRLSTVVALAPVLTGAVQLRSSLWTHDPTAHAQHLDSYIPTESSREALIGILRGTRNAAPKRVHFVTGSYGTGKSYLLLVLASLLGLSLRDDRLQRLLGRIRKGEDVYDDGLASELDQARKIEEASGRPGYHYLIVVPDYSDRQYDRALLQALRVALQGAGIDYRFPTEFAEAQEVLERWRQERPEFIEKLEPLLSKDASNVEQLARQLTEHDGEALERFGVYFQAVTGAPYRSARVSLEDTFSQTSKYLQTKHGYRGIAVLFDEFGFFLEEAASGRAGTAIAAVQDFMEFARNRPGADIQLVLAAHRSLTDYGTGEGGRAEMKKMEGRLEATYRLRTSATHHEAENMIAGAFVVPEDADEEARKVMLRTLCATAEDERWTDIATSWYQHASTDWVKQTVVTGSYPLHPTTTLALPGLSDEIGQNTRTMFRFLSPSEPHGAAEFIAQNAVGSRDGRLSLLTLDLLFDYFVAPAAGDKSSAGRAGRELHAYKAARAVLRTTDPLADRILKLITTITLFGDSRLQATPQTLHWALNLGPEDQEATDALLDVLVAQGAIRQNQATKIYSFRSAGGTTTDALLAEKKREIGRLTPSELRDFLRDARSPGHYDPIAYNDKYKTNRRVAFDYVVPGGEPSVVALWNERFTKLYEKGDSKDYEGNFVVLYGLYEEESDREGLVRALSIATRKHNTFIAAVAASPVALADHALNVAATMAALDDPKVKGDDDAVNELASLLEQYRQALASALDRTLAPGNFAWFQDGEQRHAAGTLKTRTLHQFLAAAVGDVFPDTPVISSDVVQQYPSVNSSKHRKDREVAVSYMLGAVPFTMDGTSSVDAVLKGLLQPNGMFEQQTLKNNQAYGQVVEPPEGTSARAAWQALEKRVLARNTPRRSISLQSALSVLYAPPYGLSWTAAELMLGAFVAVQRDSFELRKNMRQHAITGESLLEACRKSGFELVRQAITPAERRLLDALEKSLSRAKVKDIEHSLGPWADPAARLSEWYQALPELTRKFAGDEYEYLQPLFDALADYRGKRSDEQGRELLLSIVPQQFDAPHWDGTPGRDEYMQRLETALKAGTAFADEFAERVLIEVAYKAFEQVCSGSKEFAKIVDDWRSGLSAAAKMNTYNSPADALLKTVNRSSPDSIIHQYLTQLPPEWGMASYKGWKTKKQRDEYLRTFRDAIREINAYRASPLPALQRLVKEALAAEITSESDVDATFKAWLGRLSEPAATRLEEGGFGTEVKALFAAIHGTGTVEERYLQALPRAIPQVPGEWPNWPPYAINVLCQDVAKAVKEVQTWEPPLSLEGVAAALLDRLEWSSTDAADPVTALDEAAQAWYNDLAPATQRHRFAGLAQTFVESVRSKAGLSSALTETLPRAAGLLPLSQATEKESSEHLLDRLVAAVEEVETWRRPLVDVLQLLVDGDEPALTEASAYMLRLAQWARSTQARADDESLSETARAFLSWATAGTRWKEAFTSFVRTCNLPEEVHTWTPDEDQRFADTVAAARTEIDGWKPPPIDPADLCRALAEALREVLRRTGATRAELMSVLDDAAATLGEP